MELDKDLWLGNTIHTKPLQFGDAEPQIATKDEWAGCLLASGASSSGVLSRETSKHGVTKGKRNTTHLVLPVSVQGRRHEDLIFPSNFEVAPCV